MTEKQALRRAAENMTRGITLRPNQLKIVMDNKEDGACALGTLRVGQGSRRVGNLSTDQSAFDYALRERFGGGIIVCNDTLHIEREAMVQVACEGAGLA